MQAKYIKFIYLIKNVKSKTIVGQNIKNNCWTEYKEIGTLAHCQEEYKTWQPVWNSYGMYFLEKLKIEFHSTQYTTFKI